MDCLSSLKPCTSLFLDTGSLNRQWRSIKHTSEPEHDKSRSRINIQTLGIGYGALCKQSQLSSCDHDSSFLAANILETIRKLRLVEVHLERYATVIVWGKEIKYNTFTLRCRSVRSGAVNFNLMSLFETIRKQIITATTVRIMISKCRLSREVWLYLFPEEIKNKAKGKKNLCRWKREKPQRIFSVKLTETSRWQAKLLAHLNVQTASTLTAQFLKTWSHLVMIALALWLGLKQPFILPISNSQTD